MNRYSLLRAGLWTNVVLCAGLALFALLRATPLSEWTGIPRPVLVVAAIALLGVAALAGFVARAESPNLTLARLIVWGDDAYVLGTVLLLAVVQPPITSAGYVLIGAAGAATAVVAVLEWAGLRRATMASSSHAAAVR